MGTKKIDIEACSGEPPTKPWKEKLKKKEQMMKKKSDNVEIMEQSSKSFPARESSPEKLNEFEKQCSGFKSNANKFKGARGGVAADADLLAELKSISTSSSKNRFDIDENNVLQNDSDICSSVPENVLRKEKKENVTNLSEDSIKPWKRKSKKTR